MGDIIDDIKQHE